MKRGRGRRVVVATSLAGMLIVAGWWLSRNEPPPQSAEGSPTLTKEASTSAASDLVPPPARRPLRDFADDPLIGRLGQPGRTQQQDFDVIAAVFDAWQTNFPGEGNPGGENRDVTTSLSGQNRWRLELVPPDHPLINGEGELCDRWGTPLFFHQLSGTAMELRSAGPDQRFYSDDDIVATPPVAGGGTGR